MAQFIPKANHFQALKNKVCVLSGGSTGIGAATATILAQQGAKVVIGDINTKAGNELASHLKSTTSGEATFTSCDVTHYQDIYNLFKTAHSRYGRVDHAVSCAGIFERGTWFSPDLTIENVGKEPGPSTVIDVNVMGTANFARVAVPFMRDSMTEDEKSSHEKSLTFLSSVNAFRESPKLYMYQTSKHAIQGLMRSMRKPIFEEHHIRVNCVCPGVTDTPMTIGIVEKFRDAGLFWQPADAVAKIILGIQVEQGMNGKAIYVEGGDGWEFEDSCLAEQPRWLGEEPTRRMRVNSEAVQKGALSGNK